MNLEENIQKTHSIFVYADGKFVGRKDLSVELDPQSQGEKMFINASAQEMLIRRGIPWMRARIEVRKLLPLHTFHMCNRFVEDCCEI